MVFDYTLADLRKKLIGKRAVHAGFYSRFDGAMITEPFDGMVADVFRGDPDGHPFVLVECGTIYRHNPIDPRITFTDPVSPSDPS